MVRWIFALIVALVVGFCVYVVMSNRLPEGLGVVDGQFSSCPISPNCVSTQADPEDATHYVEPIVYRGDRKETQLQIESLLLTSSNVRIVSSELGYVHFEVKSKLIGYIDDVEFYLPEADSVVHFRSASRAGYSDLGANRERFNQINNFLIR
ncbi:hypothetical protein MUS1_12805 [Marinomonas ushuaiensis DSM 15871]|uniref:DUF1499 domain-containing protein n=1 Tax=Marinomonas ushuaiensis DSM 15871 TaxID=1122207 RepID=X7E6Q7_9GAMM|nr:DUF1499 domain-containing protein [Marinomonas ushuaiensis]ETX10851.1 hypothetical protein MUS1_12805 [Marinomonas ushuaiensis DSM 15871]